MHLLCLITLLLLSCAPASLFAAPGDAAKEFTLDNGLKVLFVEDHKGPLATFQIWYRVGSRDEPSGKSGMSHLLEHMMFKGTLKHSSKEFTGIIQRNGGTDNAHTTKDYTMYHQSLPSDKIGLSVVLEADRMKNLLLDPREVESEQKVVMEERRMRYEDDPQNALYELVVATALKAHPYRRPVIGWMSDIASIEHTDLRRHYVTYYSPENAFIVVAGDVNPEALLPNIRESFGAVSPSISQIRRTVSVEPEQRGEKRVRLKKEAELPFVIIAYPVPSFPQEDSFALEVLSTLLSDGKSSRLYRTLVYDQRIALNAFADYSGLSRDPFLFVLGGTAAPGKGAEDLEKGILAEIQKVLKSPPTEREIQKAKNQIEAAFVFAQDSTYSRALYTGLFEMLGNWRLMETYLDGVRKVTGEDLVRVAEKYFSDDRRTVGILVPVKVSP